LFRSLLCNLTPNANNDLVRMKRFLSYTICLLQLLAPVLAICDTERSVFQACILDDLKADTECLNELTSYWSCVTNTEELEGFELCNRQYFDVFSICARASGSCAQCGASVNETEPADCVAAKSNWCEGSWATCCKPCQAWADDYASCLKKDVCTTFPTQPEQCTSSAKVSTMKMATMFFSFISAAYFL
jgi:hypothetical protein